MGDDVAPEEPGRETHLSRAVAAHPQRHARCHARRESDFGRDQQADWRLPRRHRRGRSPSSQMKFELLSPFQPQGDQPSAIHQLIDGVRAGLRDQVLLGVTRSGKTFTVAKLIEDLNRPTLVLSHNKTLAAQPYPEFTNFLPNNQLEYF